MFLSGGLKKYLASIDESIRGRGGLVVSAKASESLLRGSNAASTSSGIACRDPEEFSPGAPVLLELDSVGTVRTEFEKIEA